MPNQAAVPWMSIVPIGESRSSYNGLIILTFLIASGTITAMVIHRFATRATRRISVLSAISLVLALETTVVPEGPASCAPPPG